MYMCVKRPQAFPLLIICVLFLSDAAWAQAKISVKDVEQWSVEEISLDSSGIYKNPFTDVQIQARFTSKEKTILVAGFYDGDETWRIRFMPEQQGAEAAPMILPVFRGPNGNPFERQRKMLIGQ